EAASSIPPWLPLEAVRATSTIGSWGRLMAATLAATLAPARGLAQAEPPPATRPTPRTLDINEIRVFGADHLTAAEVESALTPFVGPRRTLEDVEKARAALEKEYVDKGFQAVVVAIPPQTVRDGVVTLQVTEGKVGRLRVNGTRWFSPFLVRQQAPSVA